MTCDYRWPLRDPNEEDLREQNEHECVLDFGHDGDHRCKCGVRASGVTEQLRRMVPWGSYTLPVDDNHALLVGSLVGMVMKAKQDGFPYDAEIIDDEEGNHLATFAINAPSGRYFVQVVKVAPQ